jgi:23S rRNA pseudouridine955/2504/2580 synthase/23S rRNA pseudouridine1911/1915/1917 synthase
VIVNKPANYLSIPDRSQSDTTSILEFLQSKYEEVFIVHRLDRETSGIMCFARDAEAHRNLNEQFFKREVKKCYWAIVDGTLRPETGEIDQPIMLHPTGVKMMAHPKGKKSLTLYRSLEQFKNYTFVEAAIQTGRMHQIRIHFSHIGYPLMADGLYSKKNAFYVSSIKKRYNLNENEESERPLLNRTALHAYSLEIYHPVTKMVLSFSADPPKDFQAVLQQLRKYNKTPIL